VHVRPAVHNRGHGHFSANGRDLVCNCQTATVAGGDAEPQRILLQMTGEALNVSGRRSLAGAAPTT
jgi:hypothetical protein